LILASFKPTLKKDMTPSDILLDYIYKEKKINKKDYKNTVTIQIKYNNTKIIGQEIYVVLDGHGDDKNGTLKITILALQTAHYDYTYKKQQPTISRS
jgi:hypothetical protein